MKTWMRNGLGFLAAAALITTAGLGCKDKTTEPAPDTTQVSPEMVAESLQMAYRDRDIDLYDKLLAPEFRFYFQDADVSQDLGRVYWIHDQDSTATGILFRTPQVNGIYVTLTYGEATAATEVGMPPGAMKVHATAHLEVDDVNGTTYVVDGDFEDFYFRKGLLQNAGEDTTKWYLFEWHDINHARGNGAGPGGLSGVESTATERTTWGSIKLMYR